MERLLQQVVPSGGAEMKLAIVTAHAGADSLNDAMVSWGYSDDCFSPWINRLTDTTDVSLTGERNSGYLPVRSSGIDLLIADGRGSALQGFNDLLKAAVNNNYDIMAYLHDDTIIMERDWIPKVMREFEDPSVGLVGFGGSRTHGHPDLYKIPYEISQLSRGEYMSNALDAETHGTRYEGPPIDAAVLDGFALIFRREVLEKAGGWPVNDLVFHGYDFWGCCMTHRLGYRIRLVPIKCHHLGGRTSVGQKMDDGQNHAKGHRWIYDNFRDVLPWRCA
eukprot:GHVR01021828.1.p1 GENE.GHVR01021828.1~~GHVR01021828.1.p1  ORF type:complete len:277 (-),score=25.60 GHVR01021828.1:158-988(-)